MIVRKVSNNYSKRRLITVWSRECSARISIWSTIRKWWWCNKRNIKNNINSRSKCLNKNNSSHNISKNIKKNIKKNININNNPNTPSPKQSSQTTPTHNYHHFPTRHQPTTEQAVYKSNTYPHRRTKLLMKWN